MEEMKSLIMEAISAGNERNEDKFIQIQEEIVAVQDIVEGFEGNRDTAPKRHQQSNGGR